MHCSNVQQRLQQATTNAAITADSELMAHLKTCEPCNDYAQELRLTRLLANTPVPAMREGFADQALARAWDVGQHQQAEKPIRRYAVAGMAASLLLGVLLVSQWGTISTPVVQPATMAQVEVAPAATREVQVRLVSKEALPDAIITVQLEGDVALTGYPGTQTLRWQTAIAAGNNQMALPISLKGNNALGGVISIEVRSGDASKTLHFKVQPGTSLAMLNPVYLASI
jgi:hypothetical protein